MIGDALQVALALHAVPSRTAEARARALPDDVTQVLRLAAGHSATVAEASSALDLTADELIDSSRFFIEQQMLARELENDPWRVLGVPPGADPELIREHRRLIVGLVHPDRSQDWAHAFSDRVNRAWRELKTPGGRKAALKTLNRNAETPSASNGAGSATSADDDWESSHSGNDSTLNPRDGIATVQTHIDGPAEKAADRSDGPINRASLIGSSVLAVAVIGLLLWGLLGTGPGEEVLVHMGPDDSPAVSELTQGQRDSTPAWQTDEPPAALDDQVLSAVPTGTHSPVPAPRPAAQPEASVASETHPAARLASQAAPPSSAAGPAPPPLGRAVPRPSARTPNTQQAPSAAAASESERDSIVVAAAPAPPAVSAAASKSTSSSTPSSVRSVAQQEPLAGAAGIDRRRRATPAAIPESVVAVDQVAKPSTPAAPPTPAPVAVASTELARPVVKPQPPLALGKSEIDGLLSKFSSHYAGGDLPNLIGLFSEHANSARGGSVALAADYAKLFDSTRDREIDMRPETWRYDGETLRGEGRFVARYYRSGKLFRQVVKGQLRFVMIIENGAPRLLRLDSQIDGGA